MKLLVNFPDFTYFLLLKVNIINWKKLSDILIKNIAFYITYKNAWNISTMV